MRYLPIWQNFLVSRPSRCFRFFDASTTGTGQEESHLRLEAVKSGGNPTEPRNIYGNMHICLTILSNVSLLDILLGSISASFLW